jgi:hypothetical protein
LKLAAGHAYWGIVPYTPQAPFRIHLADADPLEVPTAEQIVDGLKKGGDAEFGFVVRGKARPVLLLSDRADPRSGDFFALRLLRLASLSDSEGEAVRRGGEASLFHLSANLFPGLSEESAAVLSAPVRVHRSALDAREPLGALDRDALRALIEHFVTYWQFDLRRLLAARIRELAARHRPRPAE